MINTRYSVYPNEKRAKRERRYDAGRSFKRDKKQICNVFSILSSLCRLQLDGFLFELDQSNVCRDIQKIECMPQCKDHYMDM